MPTSDWSIPTGKAITGTTYIKDTDNNIAATIEDLVDWCNNANGTYNDYTLTGLRTDFLSVSTAQAITSVKTVDTSGAIDFTNGELRIGGVAVTSSAAELNLVDGSSAGTVVNSKAAIYGSSGELNATKLQISGTDITSTPEEINLTDGSVAGTIVNNKAVIYGSAGEVNATKLQIGGVDILSTPAELNILDGVTATASDLNKTSSITSGTYTPTATIISGLDAITPEKAIYTRVGNVITVSGTIQIDPITDPDVVQFRISLPVSSNFTLTDDLGGSASGGVSTSGYGSIEASVSADEANFVISTSGGTANFSLGFSFAYEVK